MPLQPDISLRIIRALCKPELVEEIEGNLLERRDILKKSSVGQFKYWFEVLNYLRPSMLRSFRKSKNQSSMFIFNPRLAIRNLLKHRSTTFISLGGFVIGLLSVIFLYFYIENEMNHDAFQADKNVIYRAKRLSTINGEAYGVGVTSGPYAPALLNDYPSTIKSACRAYPQSGLVEVGTKQFYEEKMLFADTNFFEFFSYPLAIGDPQSVIDDVNTVVISKEIAKKYFGDLNPIGEIIEVDHEHKFTITGLLDDFPNKSQLDFDMVFNIELFNRYDWFHGWWYNGLITYVKIQTAQEAQRLNEQLPQFMDKYMGEDFERNGSKIGLAVEPYTDVYFNNKTRFDRVNHGSKTNVTILGLVALAILFIACFNYINLSIAQSYKRAKEVGVKKVLGANRSRLILQFIGESLLIMIFSVTLAIALAELLLPRFNNFFGLEVIFTWSNPVVIYFFVGLIMTILITSGLYPALLLSSFKPVSVLKGGKVSLGSNLIVRKGLVIAQFSISIFLIIATILISEQVSFMKTKNLGYNKESVLIIENNNLEIRAKKEAFKEALKNHPNVMHVGSASGAPGGYHDGTTIQISGQPESIKIRTVFADPEYLKIFDIPVVAGRGFSSELSTEIDYAMMVNEKVLKDLDLKPEDVIGKKTKIPSWDMERTIVGVFKNYHFLNLKNKIEPLGIMMGDFHRRYLVKINSHNISQTLADIEEIFTEFSPNNPISYRFQDDMLAQHYLDEEKQVRVFMMFSVISIFLACLGIFGLASYSAQQRQKELGIRKVLGATMAQIMTLISKEFMILVGVASIISIPLSWYFVSEWLTDFAYRIDLTQNWSTFIFGGLIAFVISFVTIGLKTYKAALSNPTESIRYE
ncbi:MAG: FtsX-like permease family protein [Cyclobacteriaceae bacterium]